ncbi:hypothetical protein SAMD00019534_111520 [Acytostelium subglobosum LB1]|uniref:hypothetical protein n=1 Tax=Acytostelium subglobosum LB1 TaxID=1410327 RepID=UPI000644DE80|nr:hypothetical protein SAMD00019534_111520 [Acytostelium subglobosum LB1]GAM27976.1 hypothetical protein SAMD00019534_111520 [Acytostelium subglobosum LB1]|eukprot:XP_012748935.1 hypothetical protein SAMD00019534_111520 [Acytostelium subglobosum LB1]
MLEESIYPNLQVALHSSVRWRLVTVDDCSLRLGAGTLQRKFDTDKIVKGTHERKVKITNVTIYGPSYAFKLSIASCEHFNLNINLTVLPVVPDDKMPIEQHIDIDHGVNLQEVDSLFGTRNGGFNRIFPARGIFLGEHIAPREAIIDAQEPPEPDQIAIDDEFMSLIDPGLGKVTDMKDMEDLHYDYLALNERAPNLKELVIRTNSVSINEERIKTKQIEQVNKMPKLDYHHIANTQNNISKITGLTVEMVDPENPQEIITLFYTRIMESIYIKRFAIQLPERYSDIWSIKYRASLSHSNHLTRWHRDGEYIGAKLSVEESTFSSIEIKLEPKEIYPL